MRALARALLETGEPFPFPYPLPATIHAGDLVEVLAAPKVGKSTLAADWALRVAEQGLPVLYHTTDTRLWAQAVRVAANLFDETTAAIEERRDYWSGRLEGVGYPLRWSSAPLTDLNFHEIMDAEKEYLGQYPAMVIVDVAFDLMRGEDGPGPANQVFRALHNVAGRTGAVVVALHHVKGGDAASGDQFVSMTDSLYRIERIPEVILTLWKSAPTRLSMHLAKNRTGKDGMTATLDVDYERARIGT